MANFLSTEGLTYTLQKLKLILDKKSSSDHTHNIESLNNYSKRIYDATTSRSATTFLAAPTGKDGVGSFRKIVEADLPTELETHVIPYYKTFNAGGGDGSKLYLKIISIDLTGGQYLNHPMIFMFGHRGGNAMTRLTVQFTHSTTADSAAVNTFGIAGASMDFYIVKETAGKFAIYVKKSESYDNIALYGYYKGSYMANVKVAFTDTAVASVPAGSTTATWNENVGYASKAGNVDWSNVSNHPTTISGYGITDAAPKSHGHDYAGSTSDGGAAKSVASSITIKLNSGSTEGTNMFTFNGSAAKTVNITPSSIGAVSTTGSAASAGKLDTTTAGSATQPVYFTGGKPVACTYTLEKSVPSTAKFTDTTYTTGNASTSGLTKLYTATGDATDGTMTQKAIKDALATKGSTYEHSTFNITEGWYNRVKVNTNGHVESGTNPTTLAGYGIEDAALKDHKHTASEIGLGRVENKNVSEILALMTKTNVTTALGFTPATGDHTHQYAGSTSAGGPADKVANNLVIQLNGGTTEGKNQFTFNGSGAKTVNITPDAIGAGYATGGYTHPNSGVTAGTYTSVTVNEQGHVTAGTNPNKFVTLRKSIADGNQNKWVCLGTVTIGTFGRTAVIDFWTGSGFNGASSQNSHINITIKSAWQSTASTTKACAAVATCYNCKDVDVKVVATSATVYKVYFYNPWGYPSGPMEVHGDYTSFAESTEILSSAPTGALQDVTVYHTDDSLQLTKSKVLTGRNFEGNLNIESSEAADLGVTVTNTTASTGKSVALRIGSTKTNRGLYDVSGSKWMIYSDSSNSVMANLSTSMKIKYTNGDTAASYNGSANAEVSIPKITSGTSLPSSGKDGDIFILYS